MRHRLNLLGTLAFVAISVVPTASAAPLRYEPFNYPADGSSMQGKVNPDGETWLRAGVANPPSEITVEDGNLASPSDGNLAVPTGIKKPIGNAAEIDGVGNGSGSTVRLPLGKAITSGSVYFSFALRVDDLAGSNVTNGGWFLGLNNSGAVSQGTTPSVGMARMQARIDPNDGTKYQLGVFNVNATAALMDAQTLMSLNVGETYFIVASYTFNPNAGDDVSNLWINPGSLNSSTPPAPTETTVGNDTGQIGSILLRQSPAPHLTVDELRVGTSWDEVTVPEPASLALAALAAVGATLFWPRPGRRNRRRGIEG